LMALTGLFLCSFLVIHLMGNLLLFKQDGGAAFNQYSEFMSSNIVIRTIEVGLFGALFLHSIVGVQLWFANRKVRSNQYAVKAGSETSTLASRITFVTGSIIFFFLVVHLRTLFIPSRFSATELNMYDLTVESLSNPIYGILYVVSFVLLAYHLRHGFQSAFQTFGLKGKRYEWVIEGIGFLFWFAIPFGFAAISIFLLFKS
jgi:succinate dehydrogenase / fumarate reductase cytochrome b subunit